MYLQGSPFLQHVISAGGNSAGVLHGAGPMSPRITFLFLFVIAIVFSCIPASAHSAAEMGIAPDQYDQGIPVYWPLHAILMSAGFILFMTGLVVMRYRKTADWFRTHRLLQTCGSVIFIAGLVTGYAMVSISESPHFRFFHGILGISTIILIVGTLLLGYFIGRSPETPHHLRTLHHLLGYLVIGLVLVNIVLGISMMGAVLAQ